MTWARGCSTMPLKVYSSVDLALTSLFTATAITSGLLSVKDVLFICFSQGIPAQTSSLVSLKSLKENWLPTLCKKIRTHKRLKRKIFFFPSFFFFFSIKQSAHFLNSKQTVREQRQGRNGKVKTDFACFKWRLPRVGHWIWWPWPEQRFP